MEAVCERVRRVAVISDDDHIVPDCDDHMTDSHDPTALPWASVSVSICFLYVFLIFVWLILGRRLLLFYCQSSS